jgi:UDP-N-acetylglucosamine--N-acetylmuramyl-(pentapeptide) pyrophosphoryl-undecaprenol N-acetylglucosamine transferase
VIVAGGGTGGHLFPGIAVACRLRERVGAEVVFVGSSYGIETRVVPRLGYPLRTLPTRALRGRGPAAALGAGMRFGASLVSAWRMIREIQPDLVLGVGGYASAPAVVAARLAGVPTVLLEQNAIPGVTNRWLGRIVDRVCVAFPETRSAFPSNRAVFTGNPVRGEIVQARRALEAFSVLLFGGSAGAHRLNEVGVEAMARLAQRRPAPRIVHQTGEADRDWVASRYAALGIEADVRAFIDDMGAAYAEADLVVCRAGATTIAELAAVGKPAILVPYPYAADDHQRKNAEALVQRGAARMILDRELTAELLAAEIAELRDDPARLRAMGEAARAFGRPDAADRVVDVCVERLGVRR